VVLEFCDGGDLHAHIQRVMRACHTSHASPPHTHQLKAKRDLQLETGSNADSMLMNEGLLLRIFLPLLQALPRTAAAAASATAAPRLNFIVVADCLSAITSSGARAFFYICFCCSKRALPYHASHQSRPSPSPTSPASHPFHPFHPFHPLPPLPSLSPPHPYCADRAAAGAGVLPQQRRRAPRRQAP
jgi:hypothetical protein